MDAKVQEDDGGGAVAVHVKLPRNHLQIVLRYISPIKVYKLQAPQGHFDRAQGASAEKSLWLVLGSLPYVQ